jgi:diguanylate cyclase (GGDEF)-like protein/PAS domain S-box-containing protein
MDLLAGTPLDEMALREAHATLTRILGAIEEYVYTGEMLPDGGYRLIFAGPCREQFLGLSVEEARTAVWRSYVHPDDVEAFESAHDGALDSGRLDVEYRLVGADGVLRWVRDRGRIRHEDGRCFLDGSILDVTEMHVMREQLLAARAEADRLAHIDHLTGVANRRSLGPLIEAAAGEPVALLLLDIDHFKRINDAHGHGVGDAVLVALASRLRGAVRAEDAVVRMGGEEFLVILHDIACDAELTQVAEHVRLRLAADPIRVPAGVLEVTVSIGAAPAGFPGEGFEQQLRRADRALYRAKRDGRDCVRLDGAVAGADQVAVAPAG